MTQHADLAVVGAGIIGLAHALAAAKRGQKVVVFERHGRATGASIRNFGMVWPIGQPAGELHQLALASRRIWQDTLDAARIPYQPHGSLHAAYQADEEAVLREFIDAAPSMGYECAWLGREQTLARSPALQPEGLRGALWSPTELVVDPRLTLARLPDLLRERYGVQFEFSTAVHAIALPHIETSRGKRHAERAIVCSGEDFETLYPAEFAASGLTRVKLQMLRTVPQPEGSQLGPALAAGLTLRFYRAFERCPSLPALRQRIAGQMPEYDEWVIHGLVSQTADGALTLGDSHQYGLDVDIFNREHVDDLILRYIETFLRVPSMRIAERWYGVYAKHPTEPFVRMKPAGGVTIVSSPAGSGMTLSFGIGEQTMERFS